MSIRYLILITLLVAYTPDLLAIQTSPPEVDQIVLQLGHSENVNAVAFSPDGKTALSGSWDSTTRLWNLETGEEIIRLVGFKDGEGVAIMPEQGNNVASPKGKQYINVDFGDNRVEGIEGYEKYKKFYHRPDIIKLALQLGGDAKQAIALANQKTQRK
ncbi:MAG: hypothetical protein ABFS56_14930 [Pseudomonadota bacterium]